MTLRGTHRYRGILQLALILSASLALAPPVRAVEPQEMSYWISMRGITEDAQPAFVVARYAPQTGYTTPFLGCRNRTYYLSATDATAVNAARAAGETVQIHWGAPGTAASQSAVICLIQADK